MHVGSKDFYGISGAPLRRTLASSIQWWYQINHPSITGGSLVDDMTPLSCLYHDYLRRYGRREEDVMVRDFLQLDIDGFGGGKPLSQRYRIQRFSFGIFICTVSNILNEFWYIVKYLLKYVSF